MSRLIVKNLPKHMTQERLRQHFSQKGEVTDVKLVTTKDGMSRRFGYVGFKTTEQAENAIKYFDKSFIDTSRIEVETARAIGDTTLPRAWSKYTEGSSANRRLVEKQKPAADAQQASSDAQTKEQEAMAKLTDKQKKFLTDLEGDKSDPKLMEFLEVMRPRAAAAGRTWANDDVLAAHQNDAEFAKKTVALPADADDELYEDLPSKAADAAKIEDVLIKAEADVDPLTAALDAADAERAKTLAFDSKLSDMDYLRARMAKPEEVKIHPSRLAFLEGSGAVDSSAIVNKFDHNANAHLAHRTAPQQAEHEGAFMDVDDADNERDGENRPVEVVDGHKTERDVPPAELIADTGRLMACNLAFSCTPEDIEALFKPFGPIAEVHIPIDRDTKESRGYAFILFMMPENALAAYLALDQTIFQGRILQVMPAREKPTPAEEIPRGPQTFKVKREKERKANAASDFNWNSLFMNQDTVAEAMAAKLGVRKSDILDASADNMAVRLALAETSIINETKTYLEEEGVSLDAFMKRKERSNTVLLVKNIPYTTEEDDLISAFAKFGTLGRIVLPPTRTMGLVEYTERNEAKVAFRRLAYSKFKGLPLFLEWAPMGTFKDEYDAAKEASRRETKRAEAAAKNEPPASAAKTDGEKSGAPGAKGPKSKDDVRSARKDLERTADGDLESQDAEALPVATVFVKNLNFITTDDGLRQAFTGLNGLRSARVAKKPDAKTGGKMSMGFGFLEFATKEDAMRCIKTMQRFKLDNHELELKFSNAASKPSKTSARKRGTHDDDEDDEDKTRGTKLVVRNVPFEATKKDLQQLFVSFGQVKSVRIPRKFDGQHRGFAFIDFLTKQEAKTAYESLGATHLYGRHLVLEWAKDDESVEAVRSKTAKTFVGDSNKRRRVEMGDGGDDEPYDD